jgi:hypothetical protein
MLEQLLQSPIFIVFAFLTITGVASTLAHYWYKVKRVEMETSLKHAMLERGMSADDVQKVMEAASHRSGRCDDAKRAEKADRLPR